MHRPRIQFLRYKLFKVLLSWRWPQLETWSRSSYSTVTVPQHVTWMNLLTLCLSFPPHLIMICADTERAFDSSTCTWFISFIARQPSRIHLVNKLFFNLFQNLRYRTGLPAGIRIALFIKLVLWFSQWNDQSQLRCQTRVANGILWGNWRIDKHLSCRNPIHVSRERWLKSL